MSRFLSVALLLLAPFVADAQTVTVPKEVRVAVGRLATVTVSSDGKDTKWFISDPDVDCFREYSPDGSKIVLRLIAYREGVFRLTALTCLGDKLSEPATCTITVGTPPDPGPGPGPGPDPSDPLTKELQTLLTADASKDKLTHVKALAALYKQAVGFVDATATAGDLFRTLKTAADSLIPADAIPGIRGRIQTELKATLPTTVDAILDPATKAKAKTLFARLAAALETLR